jgi:phosphatidylglycerol:prolipoprotein diacylglycerol transferase
MNAELYGRASDVPWAMVFPGDPLALPRHPSQLYQLAGEGILLFAVLWWYSSRPRPVWSTSALFLVVYGSVRFLVEFFRQPDAAIGFDLFGWMTRGQLLSLPMILVGIALFVFSYRSAGEKAARR